MMTVLSRPEVSPAAASGVSVIEEVGSQKVIKDVCFMNILGWVSSV